MKIVTDTASLFSPAEGCVAEINVTINLMSLSPTMITHGGPGCVLIQAIRK